MNTFSQKKYLKELLVVLGFLVQVMVYSQLSNGDTPPPISSQLATVIPPSPTVAGLMKFEEVPINNYTGIPDISIPISSIETLSKDISVNIALKYHPSSIAVKEFAGYTGLGWNLFAGGTISRTVRGTPDEIITPGGIDNTSKLRAGIYCKNSPAPYANHYYQVLNIIENPLPTPQEKEMLNEFLWRSFEKSILDNDHDLYQYNFMGYSGRFYIKMEYEGVLKVVKLDNDNSLKIELEYSYNDNPEGYDFEKFIIYDDKGYKYVFDIREKTHEHRAVQSNLFGNFTNESFYHPVEYISSFQLSTIYDNNIHNENNEKPIVKFDYERSDESTIIKDFMFNRTIPSAEAGLNVLMANPTKNYYVHGLSPKSVQTISSSYIQTQKLKKIEILNKAKIYFVREQGREDTNLSGDKLREIIIKDWTDSELKRFILDYSYQYVTNDIKRLILTEVKEKNTINEELVHKLFYNNKKTDVLRADYWGYMQNNFNSNNKNTDPDYCTAHVLEKISLPTGGCIIFNYESNTYSYIGDEEITDFSENPNNYDDDMQPINVLIPIDKDTAEFDYTPSEEGSSIQFDILADVQGGLLIANKSGTTEEIIFTCIGDGIQGENSYVTQEVQLEGNTRYTFTYHRPEGSTEPIKATLNAYIKNYHRNQEQFLYGGGIRIKTIGYFDEDVAQDFYKTPNYDTSLPQKQKNYDYDFFETNRSSGALVFAKPIFVYENYNKMWLEPYNLLIPCDLKGNTYAYHIFTTTLDYNTLAVVRTQGSDVGYKNVTVWESDNGKSEFIYTSPIDYPEENYSTTYPFFPSKNIDYKRGAIEKEKHYRQGDMKVLSQTDYFYYNYQNFEGEEQTGMKVFGTSCPAAFKFSTYQHFYNYIQYTPSQIAGCGSSEEWYNICALPGAGHNYIAYYTGIKQAYGWRRLESKVTTNYFYEGSNQSSVTQTETFDYYDNNKKLKYHYISNSLGETLKTNYYYDPHSANRNRIGILKKTETRRNNTLLETRQINYTNAWQGNNAYLPENILVSKATNALEPRIQYLKYDQYSNPLEVKQENGIHIVYLWGYNNAYPVAKIENMEYSLIPASLITDIQTASNNNNEIALLDALTNLRDHSALANAMVTTYTYKPLVGISSVTDPRGYKTIYQYDKFGRLEFIKDAENNKLEEHQYYYRP